MADDTTTPDTDQTPTADAAADGAQEIQDAGQMAEQALADAQSVADELGGSASGRNVDLPNFQQVLADVEASGLDLLHDVDLNVEIELGRTSMLVEDVLRLSEGSVVELDKLAGDPVDVYANGRLVARGEVLVLNDNFCVRVSEIVGETDEADAKDSEPADTADAQDASADAATTEQPSPQA
jgi:flagellar motor switch protein FliN/FliY